MIVGFVRDHQKNIQKMQKTQYPRADAEAAERLVTDGPQPSVYNNTRRKTDLTDQSMDGLIRAVTTNCATAALMFAIIKRGSQENVWLEKQKSSRVQLESRHLS